MEPFNLSLESLQAVLKLKQWAEAHPFTENDLRGIVEHGRPPVAERINHAINVDNMRVVFSVEQQAVGLVKHMSINTEKQFPSPQIVCELLEAFGFVHNLNKLSAKGKFYIYVEERVINFLESGEKT